MPTYEYVCTDCEHTFDAVQSFSEDALQTCPSCGQDTLRKKFSAAGIIFKGSGWHIKDYASSSSGSSTTASTSSNSDSASTSSSDSSSTGGTTSSSDSGASSTSGGSSSSGSKTTSDD